MRLLIQPSGTLERILQDRPMLARHRRRALHTVVHILQPRAEIYQRLNVGRRRIPRFVRLEPGIGLLRGHGPLAQAGIVLVQVVQEHRGHRPVIHAVIQRGIVLPRAGPGRLGIPIRRRGLFPLDGQLEFLLQLRLRGRGRVFRLTRRIVLPRKQAQGTRLEERGRLLQGRRLVVGIRRGHGLL